MSSRWRIYYGDGSTASSEEVEPFSVPTVNVQVVASESPSPRGFELCHSKDYYIWKGDEWNGCDIGGLWDYLILWPGAKYVLLGRSIHNEEFHAVVRRASVEGLG